MEVLLLTLILIGAKRFDEFKEISKCTHLFFEVELDIL
jgi:hypothetical protein